MATCNQSVKVEDENHIGVADVTVWGGILETGDTCTTRADGICNLSLYPHQTYGHNFLVISFPSGYECVICGQYDVEICTEEPIVFSLVNLHVISAPDRLANAIVVKNQSALAGALASRTEGFNIPGWTKPPFICFICGKTLNTEESYLTHMVGHLTAYEGGGGE